MREADSWFDSRWLFFVRPLDFTQLHPHPPLLLNQEGAELLCVSSCKKTLNCHEMNKSKKLNVYLTLTKMKPKVVLMWQTEESYTLCNERI